FPSKLMASRMFLISPQKGKLPPQERSLSDMEKKILENAVSISRRQLSYFAPPSRLMEYSGRLSYPFSAAKPAVSRSPNGPAEFIINTSLGSFSLNHLEIQFSVISLII